MEKWYEEMSSAAQTAFSNIVPAAHQVDINRSVANLPGGLTHKRIGVKEYWYYQFKDLEGKTKQIYLGGSTDEVQGLIEKFRSKEATEAAILHLSKLSRAAIELGAQAVERTHFRIIQRLADCGFFHAGGVLIGAHAFLAYQNHLGVRWTAGNRTQDLDFSHPGKKLSIALPDGIKIDAKSAIESLKMGFIPNVSKTTYIKVDQPDLQLDFVTEMVRGDNKPIRVDSLNLTMQPLKFMNYSMEATMRAILLSRNGPVVVNVPRPERYALHKLIVFGERPMEMRTKAKKDLQQAGALISYLNENEPEALIDAWRVIQENGRNWEMRCRAGAKGLLDHYPELDLSFILDKPLGYQR